MNATEGQRPDFFDGQVLRHVEIPGLSLGEIRYPAGCARSGHVHELACFHFLYQGGYVESRGKTSSECRTFTLAFQPQGHEHSYRSSGGASKSFTVELQDSWVANLRDYSLRLDQPGYFRGGSISWLMGKLYREFLLLDSASSLVIEALTMELTVEVSRRGEQLADDRGPLWLRQVRDLIHERFAEPLSLRDLGQSVGVHPVHLARVFRRHYRATVGEYLRQLRVEFAGQQIAHSQSTLAEIALAAGFSDQSQFTNTFKRATGLTPAQFRAQVRGR